MARLVLGVAGAAIGGFFGGPVGARVGFALGSLAGGAFEPNQKVQGPRLADLKTPAASYGAPIFYIEGHPRIAGNWAWCSTKRELAHTQSQGKGGPGVDSTTYTYEMDVLIVLTEGTFAGVRRVWDSGKLIWTAADDADADSLAASAATPAWREMRVLTGAADQLPDPTYEAAFGVGNVPAMRDRGCIVIEGLNLGSNGQPPVLTFEVCRSSTAAIDSDLLLNASLLTDAADSVVPPATLVATNPGLIDYSSLSATFWDQGAGVARLEYSATRINPADPAYVGRAFNVDVDIEVLAVTGTGTGDASQFLQIKNPAGADSVALHFRVISSVLKLYVIINYNPGQDTNFGSEYPITLNVVHNFRIEFAATSSALNVYVDGVLVWASSRTRLSAPVIQFGMVSAVALPGATKYRAANLRAYVGDEPVDTTTLTLEDAPLDQVVLRQCERGGLTAAQVDVTALASKSVRSMAVGPMSPRAVIEMLLKAYPFEAVEGDKLKFVMRGGTPAATIAYADMGAASDGSETPEPLPLVRANDIEVPQQITLKYCNVDDDYQDGAETSARLLIGGAGVRVEEIAIGMTPTEAKRLVNVMVMDAAASMLRVGPIALTRKHTALEPTDVVLLTDHDDSTWRTRFSKRTDAQGVLTFEGVIDDATVLSSSVVTSGGYNSSSIVKSVADTVLELLDIPILRDVDNSPGIYAAVKGASTPWSGAALFRSLDDVTYDKELDAYTASVIGTCTTTLGDYTGGNVFDRGNSVTVNVGAGTLASSTHDLLIAGPANAALIGSEIVQFQAAKLVSAGVYTLSGLLRGRRGTDWAMTDHVAGDRFVLLDSAALRRIADQIAYLDVEWYWKAVSFRKSLATATAETFTDTGVALKPFAPVDLRTSTASDGAITLTWHRRSRLSSRFVATTGTPLGEASESYSIDVIDQADDSVVRTLTSSSESVTYSAADQATDGTFDIRFSVHQLSAIVGRGYPATLDL